MNKSGIQLVSRNSAFGGVFFSVVSNTKIIPQTIATSSGELKFLHATQENCHGTSRWSLTLYGLRFKRSEDDAGGLKDLQIGLQRIQEKSRVLEIEAYDSKGSYVDHCHSTSTMTLSWNDYFRTTLSRRYITELSFSTIMNADQNRLGLPPAHKGVVEAELLIIKIYFSRPQNISFPS